MKRLTILITMLMATSSWAYNDSDFLKFKATNSCENCDLSEISMLGDRNIFDLGFGARLSRAKLSKANLTNADLNRANLDYANLTNANLTNINLSDASLIDSATMCSSPSGSSWFGLNA